jgi:primosomal protein N' (replication factor Y) (superfamily II helicase)
VAGTAGRGGKPKVAAGSLPVARVAVDVSLPHLDRPFDYLVPEKLSAQAVPGCRVRVRFAGRLTDGYLLQRADASEHEGKLAFLERVVSPEPVLTAEIFGLARAVADRYGGTLADVLRLAIPPRHAAAEKAPADSAAAEPVAGGGVAADAGADEAPVSGVAVDGAPAAGVAVDGAPASGAAADEARAPGAAAEPHALEAKPAAPPLPAPAPGPWARYPAGPSFLAALAGGRAPRAAWSALPGPHWPEEIAVAAATAAAAGKGTLIVVPDARDLGLVDAALTDVLGAGRHVSLAAGLGPAERYRRWLKVARGQARVVAGTRSAMFAPVAGLGLVVIWDDGDDLHEEPRAPYPHVREVLALRAHRGNAAALLGGFARTTEVTQLVHSGWAAALIADRATVRRSAPRITAAGDDAELARDEAARSARMPSLALRTAREALASGPVLFQVPRRGYVVAVACGRCGARARCPACGGPLALPGAGAAAVCGWCGKTAPPRCSQCGQPGLRALVVGAGRTAEELGRAFPTATVRTSGGADVISEIGSEPAVIVATPGAEPRAAGGYSAAVLLDGWALLGRASLRASEETLRRWLNAAALVRPAGPPGPGGRGGWCAEGGSVVVVAEATLLPVQALVRWDPVTHAERELAERRELRFPPAVRVAALTGPDRAVQDIIAAAELPAGAEVLGPVPVSGGRFDQQQDEAAAVRVLVRVDRRSGTALACALRSAQATRTARKDSGVVRLQLDPAELL